MVLPTDPMAPCPAHNSASESGLVTATDWATATPSVVHGVERTAVLRPPSAVTMTVVPLSTAATRACVAIRSCSGPETRSLVTRCHPPPPSGRRCRLAPGAHPFIASQLAVSTRTWPSITSSDRIDPAGAAVRAQCSPPSVVSHSPLPKTKPCPGVPNRIPHTAGPVMLDGWPSGTTGAGRPRQLAPRSRVRTIDVHGACEHGAVPSTYASCGETNVTEVAANPPGTGPPAGSGTNEPWMGWVAGYTIAECPVAAGVVGVVGPAV